MRYMLMSNIDASVVAAMDPAARDAVMARFVSFTQALAESGVLRSAEHLHPVEAATTVRTRHGETVVTDGPFAEVTERFGGFWIIEAADLDTALKHAADCPAAECGSVEVRPVHELG